MSIQAAPVHSYVYVTLTEPDGSEKIVRMVYPHDGTVQAVNEALAHWGSDLPQGWRIREVQVHHDEPRRFRPEKVVTSAYEAREY